MGKLFASTALTTGDRLSAETRNNRRWRENVATAGNSRKAYRFRRSEIRQHHPLDACGTAEQQRYRAVPATSNISIRLLLTTADNSPLLGSNTALGGSLLMDVAIPALAAFVAACATKVTSLNAGSSYFYQFVAGNVLRAMSAPSRPAGCRRRH